jgi:hypothetical protein
MKPMVPVQLQVSVVLVLLIFLATVAWLIRTSKLDPRRSLFWLLSTLFALAVALAPGVLLRLSRALEFEVPSNAFFALAMVYLAVNVLSNTISSSANAGRISRLAQECALLRAEIDELRAAGGRPR